MSAMRRSMNYAQPHGDAHDHRRAQQRRDEQSHLRIQCNYLLKHHKPYLSASISFALYPSSHGGTYDTYHKPTLSPRIDCHKEKRLFLRDRLVMLVSSSLTIVFSPPTFRVGILRACAASNYPRSRSLPRLQRHATSVDHFESNANESVPGSTRHARLRATTPSLCISSSSRHFNVSCALLP